LGEETLARFHALKARCDPDGLLETQLYRRLLLPSRPAVPAHAQPRAEFAPLPLPLGPPRPSNGGKGGNGHPPPG
jgi:hypothetical protein